MALTVASISLVLRGLETLWWKIRERREARREAELEVEESAVELVVWSASGSLGEREGGGTGGEGGGVGVGGGWGGGGGGGWGWGLWVGGSEGMECCCGCTTESYIEACSIVI